MAKDIALGPFRGINNRLRDTQLAVSEGGRPAGNFLRDALNVDLGESGTVLRRQGYALALAGSQMRSLHRLNDGRALVARGSRVLLLTERGGQLDSVVAFDGVSPFNELSYANVGADTYFSDGVQFWRWRSEVITPHGVPIPSTRPSISLKAGGSLPAGVYQVAFAHLAADGQESGMTDKVAVDVSFNQAEISFRIPTAQLPDGVIAVVAYMSDVNGDQLYRMAANGVPGAVIRIGLLPEGGSQAQTQYLTPMPAGRIVREYKGRLLVARGNVLYKSQPYAYALHDPVADFVLFPADIDMVAPVEGGVYVAADKTYFIAGDFEGMRVVLPCGAAFGSDTSLPESTGVAWLSHRGLVTADTLGTVSSKQEATVAIDKPQAAATLFREERGMRQLVSAVSQTERGSVAKALSFMDAQVVRTGD